MIGIRYPNILVENRYFVTIMADAQNPYVHVISFFDRICQRLPMLMQIIHDHRACGAIFSSKENFTFPYL